MARNPLSNAEELSLLFSKRFSNLYSVLAGRSADYVPADFAVCVWRGQWLARLRCLYVPDMSHVIAFGSGVTPWDAVSALQAAVSRGGWKADRPYRPQERDDGLVVRSDRAYRSAAERLQASIPPGGPRPHQVVLDNGHQ